ncbi:MAG: PHB depolymerase family esterase [Pseudomonadota bacterium]
MRPLLLALLWLWSAATIAQPAPGWYDDRPFDAAGTTRYFRYFVPATVAPAPALMILLHGGGSSMREVVDRNPAGTWLDVAEDDGFVLLLPNGVNVETGDAFGDQQQWNDCRTEPGAATSTADDVGFIVALAAWAVDTLGVDPDRIYVGGSSNGGMMSFRLADEAPAPFAAIATFIANRPANSECVETRRPVPMLVVVGTADPLMPFAGGQVASDRGLVLSADETRDYWTVRNAVVGGAKRSELPDLDPDDGSRITREDFRAGPGDAPVAYLVMEGGGHAMPSILRQLSAFLERFLGPQNHDVEGPALAWDFLREHVRDSDRAFASGFE